ncbi:MAG: amidohydrolase [Candidatus Omnitrophica bacterium]|nr:amidohydrolase [Candidatus Omnitrophota bacterium]
MFKAIIVFIGLFLICADSSAATARQSVDTIISGGTVVTVNSAMDVIEDGAVAIKDGTILAVGKRAAITSRFGAKQVIKAQGQIVMPGLVNTHTHIPMVMFRGYADDLPLLQWLKEYIWPAEARFVKPDSVRIASYLAIAEMIRSGTTTFSDSYFFEDVVASVARKANIRAVVGECLLDFPTPNSKTSEEGLKYTEALIREYSGDRLVTVAVAPHAPYTCSPELLKKALELSDKYNAPLHIHVAETKDEVSDLELRFHMRPVGYLDSLGLLTARTIAAHAIQLDTAEIKVLADRKTGVAHNPESNMKLAEGIARVPEMLSTGVKVGLGTDGAASNNDLNMFEEMKAAALLHKVQTWSPTVLDARTALRMATIDGAEVLGLKNKTGSLEAGKDADIIIIDVDRPHLVPFYNVYSLLVYSVDGSDVDTVMVAGKVVMKDKKLLTINEQQALADMRALAQEIKKEASGLNEHLEGR